MAKYEWPEGITEERAEVVAAIIWTIYRHGPIVSEEGRATAALLDLLAEAGVDITPGWLNKTLHDLENPDVFGKFIARNIAGKRTYEIKCIANPNRNAFPPDPLASAADEVDVIDDLPEVEVVSDTPGVAIEPLPEVSLADKILYIVSLLNEILTEQLTAPQRRFEDELANRLTAVNAILEENVSLKAENERLRDDKRKLAAALEQANAMMRDQAQRVANGHRESVPT